MKEEKKGLRFGVIHRHTSLKAWEFAALTNLLALANITLEVVIQLEAESAGHSESNLSGSEESASGLWKSYLRWFYNPAALRPALNPADFARATPRLIFSAQLLPDEAVAALPAYRLDFLLSFAGAPTDSRLLTAASGGVWAFQFGPKATECNLPVGLEEICRAAPTTAATLGRLAASEAPVVLAQGVFRTIMHSPTQLADSVLAECARWPADVCRAWLAGVAPTGRGPLAQPPAVQTPGLTPASLPVFVGRLVGYKLRHIYHRFLRADQWNIGVVNRPIQDFLRPEALRGAVVDAPALPGRNVFYADCFARPEPGGPAVYFERYDYRVRRGTIARLDYPWRPGQPPANALDFPFHLSYPFLLGPYCLPEASTTNCLRLYELPGPLTDPAAGQVLLQVPAVDATLLEFGGKYWLFYTRADRDPMLNLFISYADALAGPWHEHAQNPVKTDIRTARPAGPFFEWEGQLYRPAQDCARDYGQAIIINEVLTLTTREYTEREVTRLCSPHPGFPDGMHTIAPLDATHTLVDFKRHRFIPFASLLAIWIAVSGPLSRITSYLRRNK